MDIPVYLKEIYDTIKSAYPDNISENEYFAILHILYNDMCDENLSLVMSLVTNKNSAEATNDIWKSCKMSFDKELLSKVEEKLMFLKGV